MRVAWELRAKLSRKTLVPDSAAVLGGVFLQLIARIVA